MIQPRKKCVRGYIEVEEVLVVVVIMSNREVMDKGVKGKKMRKRQMYKATRLTTLLLGDTDGTSTTTRFRIIR